MSRFRYDPYKCPECEQVAKGSVDLTPGCALFRLDWETGEFLDWDGETLMFWQFYKLSDVFRLFDCKVEGMLGPQEEGVDGSDHSCRGVMVVEHFPRLLAESIGITQED